MNGIVGRKSGGNGTACRLPLPGALPLLLSPLLHGCRHSERSEESLFIDNQNNKFFL